MTFKSPWRSKDPLIESHHHALFLGYRMVRAIGLVSAALGDWWRGRRLPAEL